MRPTSWSAYNAKLQRASHVKHPRLNVFATRYALARGLPLVRFDDFSEATSASYAVALKVAFAYTALEALELALGERERTRIGQPRGVDAFRSPPQIKFLDSLTNQHGVRDGLRAHLNDFRDGRDDNLRWIAYAIRNLMFHGALTATSLLLASSESRRRLLDELADEILDAADERFSRYVQKLH